MSPVFEHLWLGGLFRDSEASRIWSPQQELSHMLAFEAAFTRALGHVGVVPAHVAGDLAGRIAAFAVDREGLRLGTARDGVPVPALVSQLRQMAGVDAAAIHTGATSQDVMDTALALTLRAFNVVLRTRLVELQQAIRDLDAQFGAQPIMGRTRMQAALPMTASDRLRTWVHPLERHRERLNQIGPRVEVLQLGGAIGNGAALAPHAGAIADFMAAALDLHLPPTTWHVSRDALADYANLLSLISGSIGKMGQDICLMAQQGIDEIGLVNGGGSSAMPHKNNPVGAELLVTLARFNAVQISGMHHALLHEQERSGAAWMLEWMILPEMALATARSLSVAREICGQVTFIGARPPD